MDHGFRVAMVSVAAIRSSSRSTNTDARFMLARTILSVITDDQCPIPKRSVRSAATAFSSAATRGASSAPAIVNRPRIDADYTSRTIRLRSQEEETAEIAEVAKNIVSSLRPLRPRRLLPTFPLEHEPEPDLRLAREAAAAAQVRQHQERRGNPAIRVGGRRIVEVGPVGDVVDVEEHFQHLLRLDLASPADARVALEVVGTVGAVAAAGVGDVLHGIAIRGRPAVGAGRHRIDQLTVAIRVDAAVEDRERRAAHVWRSTGYGDAAGSRNLGLRAERQDVAPIDVARPAPQVEV